MVPVYASGRTACTVACTAGARYGRPEEYDGPTPTTDREKLMTISAPRRDENGRSSELEERTRRAWAAYRESLRDLSGQAYDEAEGRSWARLQRKLKELDDERAALAGKGEPPAVQR